MRWLCLLLVSACLPQPLAAQSEAVVRQAGAAREAMIGGRYDEAVKLYRQLVKEMPNEPRLHLSLAMALERAGQPSAAIPELERVTRAEPRLAGGWFLLGLAYAQLRRPAEAIAPLRKAVQLDPSNSDALLELADAELGANQPGVSARDFQALAKARPDSPKAWEGLGMARLRQSEDAFAEIEKQAPQSAYYLALLAGNRAARGETEEALRLYTQSLTMDPKLIGVHYAQAELYRELGRADLARDEEKAEGVQPDWTAMLAEASGRNSARDLYLTAVAAGELAQQSFSHLAKLPPSPESHELLAQYYARAGRRLDSIGEWRKALSLDPENSRLRGRLAESLYRAREYGEAEALLRPLVARHPEDADWQYLLGSDLFSQKRDDEALPHLLKAAELEPGFLPVWQNLGLAYLDLNQAEKAVECLEKARPLDQGSISFALGTAYRRLGRAEESRAAMRRYQELRKNTGTSPAP